MRKTNREKLAFFAPDDRKYYFNVITFGPTNAPPFYTVMMKDLKDEWDTLFVLRCTEIKQLKVVVTLTAANVIMIKNPILGSKTVIDEILLWYDDKNLILIHFSCVYKVFKKYRISFRLDKCKFLKSRVEYIGHDILCKGNCPAKSKFNTINNWPLTMSGQSSFSFIGLVNFYHQYSLYMEMRLKPLQRLVKQFHRKEITSSAWTPEFINFLLTLNYTSLLL